MIEAKVYHQVDDPEAPLVDYTPFADSAFDFSDTTSCCGDDGIRGNVDDITGPAGAIDISDLTFLVAFLFGSGPQPPCEEEANIDGQFEGGFAITVSDVAHLAAYLFSGGPEPPACP